MPWLSVQYWKACYKRLKSEDSHEISAVVSIDNFILGGIGEDDHGVFEIVSGSIDECSIDFVIKYTDRRDSFTGKIISRSSTSMRAEGVFESSRNPKFKEKCQLTVEISAEVQQETDNAEKWIHETLSYIPDIAEVHDQIAIWHSLRRGVKDSERREAVKLVELKVTDAVHMANRLKDTIHKHRKGAILGRVGRFEDLTEYSQACVRDVDHFPPAFSVNGTPFDVGEEDLPAIVIDYFRQQEQERMLGLTAAHRVPMTLKHAIYWFLHRGDMVSALKLNILVPYAIWRVIRVYFDSFVDILIQMTCDFTQTNGQPFLTQPEAVDLISWLYDLYKTEQFFDLCKTDTNINYSDVCENYIEKVTGQIRLLLEMFKRGYENKQPGSRQ
ncbi:uncharacterized protein [Ptychodera flava]|uniref:uncharacterized protein n=1 Tax=Ptychodera flava TaxID=63121 RepID=UPI00396A8045